MSSHFQCLGFPLAPGEESGPALEALVGRVFEEGSPLPAPEGIHAAAWESPEGLAVTAALEVDPATGRARLLCLTPTFRGGTRLPVRVFRTLADPGCPFCDYLHGEVIVEGSDLGSPLFLEIEDRAFGRERDLRGAVLPVQVSLLAQGLRVFRDREDFLARRPEEMEPRSFLPTGLMAPPHRPRARVAGEVLEARTLVNPLSDLPFHHARLAAFGGEFDLLAAGPDAPDGLRPGAVLLADVSLLGRFPEGLPAAGEP